MLGLPLNKMGVGQDAAVSTVAETSPDCPFTKKAKSTSYAALDRYQLTDYKLPAVTLDVTKLSSQPKLSFSSSCPISSKNTFFDAEQAPVLSYKTYIEEKKSQMYQFGDLAFDALSDFNFELKSPASEETHLQDIVVPDTAESLPTLESLPQVLETTTPEPVAPVEVSVAPVLIVSKAEEVATPTPVVVKKEQPAPVVTADAIAPQRAVVSVAPVVKVVVAADANTVPVAEVKVATQNIVAPVVVSTGEAESVESAASVLPKTQNSVVTSDSTEAIPPASLPSSSVTSNSTQNGKTPVAASNRGESSPRVEVPAIGQGASAVRVESNARYFAELIKGGDGHSTQTTLYTRLFAPIPTAVDHGATDVQHLVAATVASANAAQKANRQLTAALDDAVELEWVTSDLGHNLRTVHERSSAEDGRDDHRHQEEETESV